MVNVVVNLQVKEDGIDKVLELFKQLAEATRKEEGCVQYEMLQDLTNPAALVILEQWKSQENLDAHGKTEHFITLLPQIAQYAAKEIQISACKKVV